MSQKVLYKVNENEKAKLKEILKSYDNNKDNLISILQKIQEIHGYLPRNLIYYLSRKLKVPTAEIYGVATFYTQFKFHEQGKHLIICCDGTACHVKGAPILMNYVESYLGIKPGETTLDKLFSLESVACLGCCAISPVCIIDGDIYGDLSPNKLKRILNKIKIQEEQ